MKAALACAGAVMTLVLSTIPTSAQVDLAKVLVGKWEGQAQLTRDSPGRTLIISSVRERGGKWVADGTFGDPEKRLHAVGRY